MYGTKKSERQLLAFYDFRESASPAVHPSALNEKLFALLMVKGLLFTLLPSSSALPEAGCRRLVLVV